MAITSPVMSGGRHGNSRQRTGSVLITGYPGHEEAPEEILRGFRVCGSISLWSLVQDLTAGVSASSAAAPPGGCISCARRTARGGVFLPSCRRTGISSVSSASCWYSFRTDCFFRFCHDSHRISPIHSAKTMHAIRNISGPLTRYTLLLPFFMIAIVPFCAAVSATRTDADGAFPASRRYCSTCTQVSPG